MPELLLPPEYTPFKELNLCSVLLVDVPVPLLAGGRPALLVGSGATVPLVWLSAPASPGSKDRLFVVESSRPLRPLITIQTDPLAGSIEVSVGRTIVLRAKRQSKERADVDLLDLRPLGLIVYGGASELHIGGTTMERNRLEKLEAAFAIEN